MATAREPRTMRRRQLVAGWAAVACVIALVGGRAQAEVGGVAGDLKRLRAELAGMRGVQLVQADLDGSPGSRSASPSSRRSCAA